jgi:hypothetical protein
MTSKRKSWRDVLPVHPAAEMFPMMSEAELRDLGKDIKKNGLKYPIIKWTGSDGKQYLLDGRNRLDAMELVGIQTVDDDGDLALNASCCRSGFKGSYEYPIRDPYEFVISANIHRRHLTSEQRRELIGKLLKEDPSKSDRAIAKIVKADKNTVAKVRKEKEGRGEIHHVAKRTDTKGRKQPARKQKERSVRDVTDKNKATDPAPARPTDADIARLAAMDPEFAALDPEVQRTVAMDPAMRRRLAECKSEPAPEPKPKVKQGPSRIIDEVDDPERLWDRSVSNLAGDAITMEASWTRQHGAAWRDFPVSRDLATLAREAAAAWTSLAEQLDARVVPANTPAAADDGYPDLPDSLRRAPKDVAA